MTGSQGAWSEAAPRERGGSAGGGRTRPRESNTCSCECASPQRSRPLSLAADSSVPRSTGCVRRVDKMACLVMLLLNRGATRGASWPAPRDVADEGVCDQV